MIIETEVAIPKAQDASNSTVRQFRRLVLEKDMAVPVAAMNALVLNIKMSRAATWMQLEGELRSTIAELKNCSQDDLLGRSRISLASGCDLFMLYVTRAFNMMERMDFASCRAELLRRGERFAGLSLSARSQIALLGHSFIQDGCTVLVHGVSRVVSAVLLKAAESKHFSVLVTEARPGSAGLESLRVFSERGIPTTLIQDSAVGAFMEEVDMCLVGAEGVMENGGIVNKIGTYQIALVAKALKRPFYVAVESYKFARMYPLSQRDVRCCSNSSSDGNSGDGDSAINAESTSARAQQKLSANFATQQQQQSNTGDSSAHSMKDNSNSSISDGGNCYSSSSSSSDSAVLEVPIRSKNVTVELPTTDFTPANMITLLFTDIGVLTPAAVSDELIKLYQ